MSPLWPDLEKRPKERGASIPGLPLPIPYHYATEVEGGGGGVKEGKGCIRMYVGKAVSQLATSYSLLRWSSDRGFYSSDPLSRKSFPQSFHGGVCHETDEVQVKSIPRLCSSRSVPGHLSRYPPTTSSHSQTPRKMRERKSPSEVPVSRKSIRRFPSHMISVAVPLKLLSRS